MTPLEVLPPPSVDGTNGDDSETGLNADAKDNPFRFEGFYYDTNVKSYDMEAREYRPDIGRFLSQDRFESAQGDLNLESDPLTQNRYAFAGGNPVSNVEFDGHRAACDDPKCARAFSRGQVSTANHGGTPVLHRVWLAQTAADASVPSEAREQARRELVAELLNARGGLSVAQGLGTQLARQHCAQSATAGMGSTGSQSFMASSSGFNTAVRQGCPGIQLSNNADALTYALMAGQPLTNVDLYGFGKHGQHLTRADVIPVTGVVISAALRGKIGAKTAEDIEGALQRAVDSVEPGGTPQVYGTKVHAALKEELEDVTGVRSEVSFLNGREVANGRPGSIRVDVLTDEGGTPTSILDLKTGRAGLTQRRIDEIRGHLPDELEDLPIEEIRPGR